MSKSVLLITTPFRPNVGGVETHMDDLIREGVKKKINFVVITYQPLVTKAKGQTIERGKDFIVFRIPWLRMNLFLKLEKYPLLEFIYLFPGIFLFSFFYLVFNLKKIRIIHAQGLVAGAVGVLLSQIFNKEVIISTHSIYNFPKTGFYSKFVRYLFEKSKVVLCLSKQSKDEVVRLGISEHKVAVFTYWVDQEIFRRYDKKKARRNLLLPPNKFICFFVGRLVAVKGINELLSGAKLTRGNILFMIAGDGPLYEKIREASAKSKNILFLGKIDNEDLPIYYNASDILIVPSVHEEGFGRVILESLSCGTPVIGSERGAIPEAISEKVGRLIDVTPRNIKNVLEELARNSKLVKNMSKESRKFAVKKYSSRNVRDIIKYYA